MNGQTRTEPVAAAQEEDSKTTVDTNHQHVEPVEILSSQQKTNKASLADSPQRQAWSNDTTNAHQDTHFSNDHNTSDQEAHGEQKGQNGNHLGSDRVMSGEADTTTKQGPRFRGNAPYASKNRPDSQNFHTRPTGPSIIERQGGTLGPQQRHSPLGNSPTRRNRVSPENNVCLLLSQCLLFQLF